MKMGKMGSEGPKALATGGREPDGGDGIIWRREDRGIIWRRED